MEEIIWKDVKGYEGLYQVSNTGQVRSLRGWNGKEYISRIKILKQAQGGTVPYLFVGLHKDKQIQQVNVHRLVAQTFLDNPDNLPVVMHLDDNPLNNHVDNLKWSTQKENTNTIHHRKTLSESMSQRKGELNNFYGRKHSLETRHKISEAAKHRTGSKCPASKKIICNDRVFDTVNACANYYGIPPSTMSAWLTKRNRMPNKFVELGLRYYEEI